MFSRLRMKAGEDATRGLDVLRSGVRLFFCVQVNMAVNAAKEQKDVVRQRWQAPAVRSSFSTCPALCLQDYVESLNQRAPPEAGLALIPWGVERHCSAPPSSCPTHSLQGQAMMVSWVWTSMALEESVFSSTILAFSLSLSTSMVAVALFTRDIVLAFYVCLNILLVVSVLSGFLLSLGCRRPPFFEESTAEKKARAFWEERPGLRLRRGRSDRRNDLRGPQC